MPKYLMLLRCLVWMPFVGFIQQLLLIPIVSAQLVCKGIPPATNSWCDANCNHRPPNCPSTSCKCSADTQRKCSAHKMCSGLHGDCCPSSDGTMLNCCQASSSWCSKIAKCNDLGLQGFCCPTSDGTMLDCCGARIDGTSIHNTSIKELPVDSRAILSLAPKPVVLEEDRDTDFVCCELFNSTHLPPPDWRKRYPASKPGIPATGRNDTVPAENLNRCVQICIETFYSDGCRAAAWNGLQKQCYLKSGKANLQHKPGDISFLLGLRENIQARTFALRKQLFV